MFCTQCGESIEVIDKFCWKCGAANTKRHADSSNTSAAANEIRNVSSTVDMQRRVAHTASPAPSPREDAPRPVERQQEIPAPRPQLAFENPGPPRVMAQANVAPASAAPSPWLDQVAQAGGAAQAAAPAPLPKPAPASARKPDPQQEVLYDSVGNEIASDDSSPMSLGAADIPTPSFGGYAAPVAASPARATGANAPAAVSVASKPVQSAAAPVRRRKPVLEIIVAIFLLLGAGVAVWILHASLPAKNAATTSASAIAVSLSPASAEVTAGRAADFAVTVTGTDDDRVTWTVQEGEDGGRVVTHGTKTVDGQVSSTAVYIAPDKPGTYHLIVASVADPQKTASAEVNVVRR